MSMSLMMSYPVTPIFGMNFNQACLDAGFKSLCFTSLCPIYQLKDLTGLCRPGHNLFVLKPMTNIDLTPALTKFQCPTNKPR